MKISIWCPFISEVATTKTVLNTIKSIQQFSKSEAYFDLINVFGEWDSKLSLFKNLNVNSNSMITAFTHVRPKIIIFDSFSTPIYELLNSKSELIVFIDKLNPLKRDALESLKKRCFLVSSIKDLNKAINLIEEKKSNKIMNRSFFDKFYKNKNNFKYK